MYTSNRRDFGYTFNGILTYNEKTKVLTGTLQKGSRKI